jgi:transcriptional regulator GlxA family with amidase domain
MPDTVVTLVAETSAPVRSERGLTITPNTTFANAPRCDALFVPGGIGVNPFEATRLLQVTLCLHGPPRNID